MTKQVIKILSTADFAALADAREHGAALSAELDELAKAHPDQARSFALAKTKVDEALLWAAHGVGGSA